jgi:predicted metal-dependent hydrolase
MATHIINVMHLVLPEGERAMAQALAMDNALCYLAQSPAARTSA